MKTTAYFDTETSKQHPEAVKYRSYVEKALTEYVTIESQANGRTRRWVHVPEEDKYLRVVVLADGQTVHNALFDRNFTRRMKRK